MRRDEVWTAAGKPRPVVIVQSDAFDATESITVCGLATSPTEARLARPIVEPNEANGLKVTCRLMADKIITMPRAKLGDRLGRLVDEDILRMNRAILVFLGLAG